MPGLIIFGILGYFFAKYIVKYEVVLYSVAFLLTILSVLLPDLELDYAELGVGLILIVMFAGALPVKWTLTKRWMTLRRTYSILGVILLFSHVTQYVFDSLDLMGLIAYVIMVPLMVSSFKVIRKAMSKIVWKKLHKTAYIAYVAILLHMIWIGEYIYIPIFVIYLILKGIKLQFKV
jgi:DMSO/TMAO reductase YedYZ heme-binding membrane subunit